MTQTPKTLNSDETFKLLDTLLTGYGNPAKRRLAVRNHTMALLMLDAGLRVGELVQLSVPDLLLKGKPLTALRIRAEISKSKHERIVPLSQRIHIAIKSMYENCWGTSYRIAGNFAFYTEFPWKPITARQVERIIKRAAIEALGRPIHPHVLRHTFASRMMRVTNARVVQELLGHKQLSSTQVYMHPNEDDKRKAIDSLREGKTQ